MSSEVWVGDYRTWPRTEDANLFARYYELGSRGRGRTCRPYEIAVDVESSSLLGPHAVSTLSARWLQIRRTGPSYSRPSRPCPRPFRGRSTFPSFSARGPIGRGGRGMSGVERSVVLRKVGRSTRKGRAGNGTSFKEVGRPNSYSRPSRSEYFQSGIELRLVDRYFPRNNVDQESGV